MKDKEPIYEITIQWKNKGSAEAFLNGMEGDSYLTDWKRTDPISVSQIVEKRAGKSTESTSKESL